MGKAEERSRMGCVELLPESVKEYSLRGCPWSSVKADGCGLFSLQLLLRFYCAYRVVHLHSPVGGDVTMTIEEMKNIDIRTVDPETLVDVTKIEIDESLSKEERVAEYLRQVKNPYCYRVGDMIVKNTFSNDGVSLQERFEQFARTL